MTPAGCDLLCSDVSRSEAARTALPDARRSQAMAYTAKTVAGPVRLRTAAVLPKVLGAVAPGELSPRAEGPEKTPATRHLRRAEPEPAAAVSDVPGRLVVADRG